MLKKAIISCSFILCVGLILNYSILFAKGNSPIIQINGVLFETKASESEPYVDKNNRTMVPVRFVSEALGVMNDEQHINWDAKTKRVKIMKDAKAIEIQLGSKKLLLNGTPIEMDTEAELKHGHVYIPLRYIAEALGAKIEWDSSTHIVHVLTDTTNNFSRYGLVNIISGYPVSLTGVGYSLKINDVFIYPYESDEAKALIARFGFNQMPEGTPYYLVWMNVNISNTDVESIGSDPTTNQSPFSFGFHPADEDKVQPLQPKQEFDVINNEEVLYKWRLEPNESLQSHVALILTQKEIERLFVKTEVDSSMFAIRKS